MSVETKNRYRSKDFWDIEGEKFISAHFRLEKCARIINRIAGTKESQVLDVGCGPGTLGKLLAPTIRYYGIDISIPEPADNMREYDILAHPIDFDGRRFDLVVAQGLFEYLGDHQEEKFSEISQVIADGGTFLTSYSNFAHRHPTVYEVYNNVQSQRLFRQSLSRFFTIDRVFPASHNWGHSSPNRQLLKNANMYFDFNVPFVSHKLAVEYLFICSPRNVVRLARG